MHLVAAGAGERLLAQVLDGTRTATAVARDEHAEQELPERGQMGILVDAAGHPRALLVTTDVRVVAFDEVDEEHARAEGEPDLDAWRRAFRAAPAAGHHDVPGDLPVVLERFALLHPSRESRATFRSMFGG